MSNADLKFPRYFVLGAGVPVRTGWFKPEAVQKFAQVWASDGDLSEVLPDDIRPEFLTVLRIANAGEYELLSCIADYADDNFDFDYADVTEQVMTAQPRIAEV
jgi:hypothetical protein